MEDRKEIGEAILAQHNQSLKVKAPKLRKPCISLLLLDTDQNDSYLITEIVFKNDNFSNCNRETLRIVECRTTRQGYTVFIIEILSELYTEIVANDRKLFIGATWETNVQQANACVHDRRKEVHEINE